MTLDKKLFYLLVLLLPTQLGRHFWPEFSYISGLRIDYLSPTIYLSDVLVFSIVACYLARRPKLRLYKNKFLGAVLFFLGINIIFSANRLITFYIDIKIVEYFLLGWWMVVNKESIWEKVPAKLLAVGVIFSSFLAILQLFLQRSVGGWLWWLGERTFSASTPGIAQFVWRGQLILRSYATFPHPNVLGGFLSLSLILIIYQLWKERGRNLFYITALFFGLTGLILTVSRSAWLGFWLGGFGMVVMYCQRQPKPQKRNVIFFFLLMTLVGLIIASRTGLFPKDESVMLRQTLNTAAWKMFLSHPLWGVGLGNFIPTLGSSLGRMRTVFWLQPVHNVYLLILAEGGILFFFVLLAVLWYLLKRLRVKPQKFYLFIPLSQILLISFFDHYFWTLQQGQLLLTLVIASFFGNTPLVNKPKDH